MEAVAESVYGDYVTRVRFEDGMHVHDPPILFGRIVPSCKHLFQIFSNNGLNSADTGIGEEVIDAVSAHAVRVVVNRSNDGVWS